MIKKYTHIIQFVTILAFTLFLSACNGENNSRQQTSCDEQCLTMENQQLSIKFNTQFIIVEQVYQLQITAKEPIESIYIRGTNMNMGTLPVIFSLISNKNGNYLYQSSFMLGLCAEPVMQWQLTVETKDNKFNVFDFTSYWKKPIEQ